MKIPFVLIAFIAFAIQAKAQCTDLFFSEYIEGSSYNKALEVYNPTETAIDLSDYKISIAFNGADEAAGSFVLTGTLAPADVFVISHPSADAAINDVADMTSSLLFNGDDAIWIEKISTADTLDIIGIIGNDPGTSWTVSGGNTRNHTLVRAVSVQQGNVDWDMASVEWNAFPSNTTSYIGAHTMTPCGADCENTTASFSETVCGSYTVPSGDETYTESGVYNDTLVNAAGCDSLLTINLVVNSVDLTTTISATGVTLTANASDAIYQWINCEDNQPILGETNQTFTAISNGNYAVVVTQMECTDTSTCTLINAVGIKEIENEVNYEVFPNPSYGTFMVRGLNPLSKTNISVVNIATGQFVFTKTSIGQKTCLIERNFPSGIYSVIVNNENNTIPIKLVIH